MISLLVAMALGQSMPYYCADWKNPKTCYYTSRISREPKAIRGFGRSVPTDSDPYAFFEFAPTSGAGMGTACACAAVTGAKGEAVTLARASSAYCTKEGLATTGLTTTSMVYCGSNLPRVEADGNGVLGLLVENARTNEALWSEDTTNGAWATSESGVAAPTRTADQATSPWNAATADRLEIPATTAAGSQYSYIRQPGFSAVQRTTSVFIKGNATSGTICLFSGAGANAGVLCSYDSSGWSRCSLPSNGTASTVFFLGNTSAHSVCGLTDKAAQDVFVIGFQHEAGAYATSYIPTTTAAVTRAAETSASVSVTLAAMASTGSSSAWMTPAAASESAGLPLLFMAAGGRTLYVDAANRVAMFDATNITQLSAGFAAGTAKRYWSSWTGVVTALNNVTDATSIAGTFDGTMATTGPLEFGANATLGTRNAIVSRLCIDSATTRCR